MDVLAALPTQFEVRTRAALVDEVYEIGALDTRLRRDGVARPNLPDAAQLGDLASALLAAGRQWAELALLDGGFRLNALNIGN